MSWRNFTARDVLGITEKLGLEQVRKRGRAGHPVFYYLLDGKRQLRVTLPNIHGGSGSLSTGLLQNIKTKLRLTSREFEDLVNCPLTAEQFEGLVRERTGTD